MKKFSLLWSVMILLLAIGLINAQTVNVTFRVNTATVPDTVGPNSVVQVRGGTPPLTWGNDTGGQCVNVGGDLWEVTLAFPTNTSINYKFFVNAQGDGTGNGWESDLNTGNRTLTTTTSDTILPVKFFNKINGAGQDDLPYVATDSMDIWFRVNVHRLIQYNQFNPATQVMMVKGGTWPDTWGDLTWNTAHPTKVLAPETPSQNVGQFTYPADYFWSGRVRIPNDSISVGQNIEYKFIIADKADPTTGVTWESTANRSFTVLPGKADQTIYWSFWENRPPDIAAGQDTVTVKFITDLTRAISENGFTPGDTIQAQFGDNGTSVPGTVRLLKEGFIGNIYSGTTEVYNVQAGGELQYNYYVLFNGTGVRENYFDFSDTTVGTSRPEKRKLNIPLPAPTTTIEVYDTVSSKVDPRRQPQFRNNQVLPKNVTVYWEVDLRPPYYQILLEGVTLDDIQGDIDIGPAQLDSIFVWGVCINGLAVDGWTTWGSELRNTPGKNMKDDGTQGDQTPGDSIYTTTWFYSGPDSNDVFGQIFKFGIYGGDNEAGGAGFGLNHLENIVLANPGSPDPENVTIFSQFGSINPNFYWRWNYDLGIVGIDENGPVQIVRTPRLDNNYPNPFNPVTTIRFVLPKAMDVKLEIYNALGQKVTTLIDGKRREGQHIVNWNGVDSKGYPVSSGIYFYRLSTENYEKTMKMVLMK